MPTVPGSGHEVGTQIHAPLEMGKTKTGASEGQAAGETPFPFLLGFRLIFFL